MSLVKAGAWALALAMTVLLVQSALWTERLPVLLRVGVFALAVFAAMWPARALVLLAFLAPVGHALAGRVWTVLPFALSEAVVLATLAGFLWARRRAFITARWTASPQLPATLLIAVVVASAAVQFFDLQYWHDDPWPYARILGRALADAYLTEGINFFVDHRPFVTTGAHLVEGAALFLVARSLCLEHRTLGAKIALSAVMAAAISAIAGFYTFGIMASEDGRPLLALLRETEVRWSPPTIPSLNTAGGYFMLLAFIGVGLAQRTGRRAVFAAAVALIVCGLMLTGTRSAVFAGAAALACLALWKFGRTRTTLDVRTLAIGAAATLAAGVLILAVLGPAAVLGPRGAASLEVRAHVLQASWRMIEARPVFGVGLGRYVEWIRYVRTEELQKQRQAEAHNNFLWVGAELGIVGLMTFVWLVGEGLALAARRLSPEAPDPLQLWTFAGLAAFVVTWMAWQPLSVPQAAYTFWILLGAASAGMDPGPATVTARESVPEHRRLLAAIAVIAIFGSIPLRARQAVAGLDLPKLSYGFYNPGEADGRTFRWAGPRVRFFIDPSVSVITIPIGASRGITDHDAHVVFKIDGHVVREETLPYEQWRDVRLTAPDNADRPWRVDLDISKTGLAADAPDAVRRIAIGEIVMERR